MIWFAFNMYIFICMALTAGPINRKLAARAGEVPRRHLRGGDCWPEHPHRCTARVQPG